MIPALPPLNGSAPAENLSLAGRTAIVTGAARGIGYSIAEVLSAAGAAVVLSDLDEAAITEAEQRLRAEGRRVISVIGNVAAPDVIDKLIEAPLAAFGRLDILVNNAGGSAHTPLKIEDVTSEHFDRVVDWNLRSTFFCIQRALPALRHQGGSVINMASIAGRGGTELVSPQYSAVKAGIIGMTRNLARHLGPDGIRVNVVAPGFIRSGPRAEAIWQSRDQERMKSLLPLRQRGDVEDIAMAVLYLASDLSRYVTGAVLDVNGGFFAH